MILSLSDLKKKEVINIDNGEKIGFIDDVEINTATSEVLSMIIYGRRGFFGMYAKEPDIVIKCSEIKVIGTETILISSERSPSGKEKISYHTNNTTGNNANITKKKRFVYKNLFV